MKTSRSPDVTHSSVSWCDGLRPRVQGRELDVVLKRDTGFGRWSAKGARRMWRLTSPTSRTPAHGPQRAGPRLLACQVPTTPCDAVHAGSHWTPPRFAGASALTDQGTSGVEVVNRSQVHQSGPTALRRGSSQPAWTRFRPMVRRYRHRLASGLRPARHARQHRWGSATDSRLRPIASAALRCGRSDRPHPASRPTVRRLPRT